METRVDPIQFVRPDLKTLSYHGVDSVEQIAKEVGMEVSQLVKLDANENVYGAPKTVQEAMARSSFHTYPDPTQTKFRAAVGAFHGVDPNCVVGGAGSDDILDIIIRITSPSKILISTPTFGMYSFLGKLQKAQIIDVPRNLQTFEVDVQEILRVMREEKVELVMLASPNNPTGTVFPTDHVRLLCQEQAIIVMDEAYADFRDDRQSAASLLSEFPNLVVARTLSKWAGLAGLRVGYSLSDPNFAKVMMSAKQPYNINCSAETGALAALAAYDEIYQNSILPLAAQRSVLFRRLSEEIPWLRPIPSQGNFILSQVREHSAESVRFYLRRRGILIRYFGTQGGALSDFFRISSGRPEDIDRVLSALKQYTRPSAVLFDMDGVLADVSTSYRAAILETAHHFKAPATSEDVTRLKLEGDANNDWVLTRRLIKALTGQDIPLEDVTAEFERRYQSELYKTEKLLVEPALLAELKAKGYRLGVVTGRPRSDAVRFIEDFNLTGFFEEMVCMNETPLPKPSPDPVLACMKKLGVTEAVLIGDTVDDIRAAIRAGVIGYGVVAPGAKDPETESGAMTKAGAKTILKLGLTDLLSELEKL